MLLMKGIPKWFGKAKAWRMKTMIEDICGMIGQKFYKPWDTPQLNGFNQCNVMDRQVRDLGKWRRSWASTTKCLGRTAMAQKLLLGLSRVCFMSLLYFFFLLVCFVSFRS